MDIPTNIGTDQLELLLNNVLKTEDGERIPYTFQIDDKDIVAELGAHLLQNKVFICGMAHGRAGGAVDNSWGA